jgi:uncharacterized protein
MAQYRIERRTSAGRPRAALITLAIVVLILLFGARSIAGYTIEYAWWTELGQTSTWLNMLLYSMAPVALGTLIAFAVLFAAHARALHFAGARLSDHPFYARLAAVVLLILAYFVASATIDTWTVARFAGARGIAQDPNAWRDSVFGRPFAFYVFDLPFYSLLRRYVLGLTIVTVLVYWVAARAWQLRDRLPGFRGGQIDIDPAQLLRLEGGLESRFLRGSIALVLLSLAVRAFLARYAMVWRDHGFMVGVDYVDLHFGLPLQWLVVAAFTAAAVFIWLRRWKLAIAMVIALVIQAAVPALVSALYVRPNEISLQRPFIQTHIHATRMAFGLEKRVQEIEFKAQMDAAIDPAKHRNLLENVRLWDWRAFHDTVTQIQALRPYYVFADSDVDRYTIDGRLQQVLLSPRELDIRQLADARTRWINPHFIYTHGYGMVLAEVSKITPDGLPVLLIQNAPPEVKTPSLKLTRPEIYYGEVVHEPVFVRTGQDEFNYPAGADNVHSRYDGRGGFPISSLPMRVAAALREADPNILLTGYLTPQSRMMIRRNVVERMNEVAGFLRWDPDPYLVVTDSGRLVWMIDGYTVSGVHPYARAIDVTGIGRVNYIRNAVKATVDAYDGTTTLYVFEPSDPIIQAWRSLFPALFRDAARMPADIRAHARYPEVMFRIQAETYRTFHMLDPQAFYNKEDVWDLARRVSDQSTGPEPFTPTYVVASLPGEDKPEFLLLMPFTPRSKDNLIGLMVARCDGENLGEMVVLQLSKQQLMFGPMQIAARIDQEQTISKDLTLWNQQGSRVLRGQMLVLPVEDTFLYVEPIYIQATEARMPQLKKIVLAIGNRLIYTDTYEQAIAQLTSGTGQVLAASAPSTGPPTAATVPGTPAGASRPAGADPRIERLRTHLRRYRELSSQGKWAEAGRELEAIESELK